MPKPTGPLPSIRARADASFLYLTFHGVITDTGDTDSIDITLTDRFRNAIDNQPDGYDTPPTVGQNVVTWQLDSPLEPAQYFVLINSSDVKVDNQLIEPTRLRLVEIEPPTTPHVVVTLIDSTHLLFTFSGTTVTAASQDNQNLLIDNDAGSAPIATTMTSATTVIVQVDEPVTVGTGWEIAGTWDWVTFSGSPPVDTSGVVA